MNGFQRCAVTGFVLGVLLAALLGPPVWLIALLAGAGVATGFGLVLITRLLTGRATLVYQHHALAVLATSAAVIAVSGRPVLAGLDAVALGLGVMLAVGRAGCLRAGCCHGRPAARGVRYDRTHLDGTFPEQLAGVRLFPVQALEAGLVLAVVAVGVGIVRSGAAPGAALAWFLSATAVARFGLEFLRGDAERRRRWGVTEAQWLAVAMTAAVALAGAGPPYAAVCGLLLVATAGIAARHGRRVDDRDIGALAACLHAAAHGEAMLTRLPCGALVSAGRTGAVRHVTLSSGAGSPLPKRRARRLARLVAHLAGAPGRPEIRPGGGGTVHVIVAPAAQRPRPAGGRLAHSGLP